MQRLDVVNQPLKSTFFNYSQMKDKGFEGCCTNFLTKKQRKKLFVRFFDALLKSWEKQLEEKRKLGEFKQINGKNPSEAWVNAKNLIETTK